LQKATDIEKYQFSYFAEKSISCSGQALTRQTGLILSALDSAVSDELALLALTVEV